MEPTNRTARTAGACYLMIVICGLFYLRYVPGMLINRDNIPATIQNISMHLTMFRLCILAEIVANFFYLLLAFTLYKLFQQVNKMHALLLVMFVTISIVIDFVNMQNRLAILTLINRASELRTFTSAIIRDHVYMYLDFYRNGVIANEVFWGLWLFPLGYLIFRSGYIPKVIGVLLMIGCFGYVADFVGRFFFAHFNELQISNYVIMPASLGELITCFWLLIAGVRKNKFTSQT